MKLSYLSSFIPFLHYANAGDVLALGNTDFSSTVANTDLALVKFYAPWCGHCKKIAPEFEKAATILKQNDPPVSLIEVDCTIHDKVCGEHGVSGYPTLKVFRNGESSEYQGGRQAGDMVKIMAGQAGPASSEISDNDKLNKYLNAKSTVVIGFFESDSADGAKAFQKAANELRETCKFAHSFDGEIAKSAGYALGDIVLFRPKVMKSKFEEQEEKYSKDKFTVGLIRNWVKETVRGLASIIEVSDIGELPFPAVLAIYNVDYERDPKGTQYWRNRVMKVAKDHPENNYGVAAVEQWGGFIHELGLEKSADADPKAPTIVALTDPKTKYVMTDNFDPKGVAFGKFLDDFKAGNIPKHVKSEADPDNSNVSNKVLTANNFDSYVDGSKDAFVEFYAPWCGHCKSLAPKWDEMAEEFSSDDSVVVGKFDATANDVPSQFEVQGFPTLYWVPKGKLNSPVKYQGGRETKDLIDYVKKHSSGGKDEL